MATIITDTIIQLRKSRLKENIHFLLLPEQINTTVTTYNHANALPYRSVGQESRTAGHSVAQLVLCFEFHDIEIRVAAGLCSFLEILVTSPSKLRQVIGRMEFHAFQCRTRYWLSRWLSTRLVLSS